MTLPQCFTEDSDSAISLIPLDSEQLHHWLEDQSDSVKVWVDSNRFEAAPHTYCAIAGESGALETVVYGVSANPDIWSLSKAPSELPLADYKLDCGWDEQLKSDVALGWALGSYQFDRYKNQQKETAKLVQQNASAALLNQVSAIYQVRDLINLPPDDMMPPEMACEAKKLAERFGAEFKQWIGDELLSDNFPAIHAVGRASIHAPRLLQIEWGNPEHPRLALVGKGVCFDSGGLDLKPSSAMRYMQKDMGGAAHVLGLAELIMANDLPVNLQVLVPAVENAVSGNAFHPGDILATRKGLTVEVDNTDAEGRLVLCDAIDEAGHSKPDLIIDFATLTGAARVAVGTEIACFFSNQPELAAELVEVGAELDDVTWQLPLHAPYRSMLDSGSADIVNCSSGPFGGAITAALFLKEFVPENTDWIHFDVMAWNNRVRPGRPKGGEAMGIRAIYKVLESRYAN